MGAGVGPLYGVEGYAFLKVLACFLLLALEAVEDAAAHIGMGIFGCQHCCHRVVFYGGVGVVEAVVLIPSAPEIEIAGVGVLVYQTVDNADGLIVSAEGGLYMGAAEAVVVVGGVYFIGLGVVGESHRIVALRFVAFGYKVVDHIVGLYGVAFGEIVYSFVVFLVCLVDGAEVKLPEGVVGLAACFYRHFGCQDGECRVGHLIHQIACFDVAIIYGEYCDNVVYGLGVTVQSYIGFGAEGVAGGIAAVHHHHVVEMFQRIGILFLGYEVACQAHVAHHAAFVELYDFLVLGVGKVVFALHVVHLRTAGVEVF